MSVRSYLVLIVLIFETLDPRQSDAADSPPLVTDLEKVRVRVVQLQQQLGSTAGSSEVPDRYQPIPNNEPPLSLAEAKAGFDRFQAEITRYRWWKVGLIPTNLNHPLREPAAVISGCVHLWRANFGQRKICLARAREAADFLLWAQSEAGTGGFPFPAFRGQTSDPALGAAARFLSKAEREGRLGEVTSNGWIVDDASDGGLQFDNAEAGVALFELHEITGDTNYLAAARRAADWCEARPLVANWNYNSFSVYLLAKAFAVTHEPSYRTAAARKARLGVLPGQLTKGPMAGRWVDRHNARPEYHYIMMRSLAALAAVQDSDDPARAEIMSALQLGLRARNQDYLGPGAPTKDYAMETLLWVNHEFASDAAFLRATHSAEALKALSRLVSAQARRGALPLGPRPWGMFLEHVAQTATENSSTDSSANSR